MDTTKFEEVIYRFRWQLAVILVGLIFTGAGLFLGLNKPKAELKVASSEQVGSQSEKLIIEVSGSVKNPGVYELEKGKRIEDALKMAGGILEKADISWVEKHLNRAANVVDGQKIYIPAQNEQSNSEIDKDSTVDQKSTDVLAAEISGGININEASARELEALKGIGPVTAQKIIENRPYSTVEELLSRSILKKNVYEENKDLLSVY